MKALHFLSAVCAVVFAVTSITTIQAAPISGMGTWESTLEGRDLDGNAATFEAYYDRTLDITWTANANIKGVDNWMDGLDYWDNQVAWAAGLTLGGVNGWRLPTVRPINGSTWDTTVSYDATTDRGGAPTTTDGTDGGWRDSLGNPVSEMGHMFYVTLGNSFGIFQPRNTGPFSGLQLQEHNNYWSGTEFDSDNAWVNTFDYGSQHINDKDFYKYLAWAVHDGDVVAGKHVDTCHYQGGRDSWELLTLGSSAANAHLRQHDDALPGGTTMQSGIQLDSNCVPVAVQY